MGTDLKSQSTGAKERYFGRTDHGLWFSPCRYAYIIQRGAEHEGYPCPARKDAAQLIAIVEENGDDGLHDAGHRCELVGIAIFRLARVDCLSKDPVRTTSAYLAKTGFPASVRTKYFRGGNVFASAPHIRHMQNSMWVCSNLVHV